MTDHIPESHAYELRYSPTFVKEHRRANKNRTPILFFHTWSQGRIESQGYLFTLRADGTGKAQLFEWFLGEPSDTIDTTKAFLSHCTFYLTDHDMKRAYRRYEATEQAA